MTTEVQTKYFAASAEAFVKIDAIHMLLYKHGRKFDGSSWGYVVDLTSINTQLDEIINQLKLKTMSSIYRDQWENEAEKEMRELEQKKSSYGWTAKDAERYNELQKELTK